jgi:hypothetical protein
MYVSQCKVNRSHLGPSCLFLTELYDTLSSGVDGSLPLPRISACVGGVADSQRSSTRVIYV